MKLTIGKKIIALLLFMLIITVINILIIHRYQRLQRHDTHVVNLAGRQRMLSQKIAKFAFSVASGNDSARQQLIEAVRLYDSSLKVLKGGGEMMGDIIPPAPIIMKELFDRNQSIWDIFKANAEIVTKERSDNPSFSEAVSYIKDKNKMLLKVSDEATYKFDQIYSKKVSQLRLLLIVLLGSDIFMFLIGCFLANSLAKPIKNLSKSAIKIGEGDFAQKIEVPNSGDEISDLANAFDRMIKDLKKTTVSKDYVDNIIRSMIDILIVTDPDAKIKTVNKATCDLLEYKENELVGNPISMVLAEGKFKGTGFQKLFNGDSLTSYETTYKSKNGHLIPMLTSGAVMRNKEGKLEGIAVTAKDITERKNTEEALSRAHDGLERKVEVRTAELTESNEQLNLEITERKQIEVKLKNATEQLSMLLESLPIVPYICKGGRDFVLTYIGNRVEEITGYKVKQCIEDSSFWVKHIHPDDQKKVNSAFQELYECGESNYQYRFRVADGSYKWFNNIQHLVKLPDGTASHITGTLQDITERKRLQQESEHRLQQIIQSDKLASLGKIVAGVAHEINNPNSFIIYNLPLLEETWEVVEPILTDYARAHPGWEVNGVCFDELSQDMKEIIDAIRSGSRRINSVVTNLKDYVRLHEVIDFKPVQVNDVVKKALTMVESQMERYGSKRVLNLAGTLPEVPADFHKLEQVMVNLLVNATDAVAAKDDGKISITTRYLVRLDTVLIEIEDNGEGMEPLTIDRIFEPFFTTRLDAGGTGLGLSVSYSLVKEHNGNIWVLSRKGVGSRFTVFLPVSRETELKLYHSILCLNYNVEFIDELRISSGEYVDGFLQALTKPDNLITYLEEHPEVDIVLFNSTISDAHSDLKLLEEIKKRFPLLTVIMCSDLKTVLNKNKDTAQPDYLLKKPFKMNELLEIINTVGRQRL